MSPTCVCFEPPLKSGRNSSSGGTTCASGDGNCSRSRAKRPRSSPSSDVPRVRDKPMRRVLFVAAAMTALSCTPKTPASAPTPTNPPAAPPPPPAAPPPAAQQGLRLGPSAQRYVMHTVIHIDQEFQGMHQPLDFGLRAFFGVTITGPADSTGYPTNLTIDSIVPDSGTTPPMGINLGAAKALSFVGRLTRRGEFRTHSVSDSVAAQALAPIVGSFKNFFPRIPPRGLRDCDEHQSRACGRVGGSHRHARDASRGQV